MAVVRAAERFQLAPGQATDRGQAGRLRRGVIHRRRALGGEADDVFCVEHACDAPGSKLAHAVAGHGKRAWDGILQDRPCGHGLSAAKYLPNLVGVQLVRARLPNQLARVVAAKRRASCLKHVCRFRSVGQQVEHVG